VRNISYLHMKSFIKVALICSFGFCFSCTETFPELPPETDTGAGTFGCLVNNELVFASSGYNRSNAEAEYNQNTDQLIINARCQFGQKFIFLINNPYKKQDILIDTVRYLPPNSTEWIEAIQTGCFRITRIDNFIDDFEVVSGNFFFELNESGKTPIRITKGRFDLFLHFY